MKRCSECLEEVEMFADDVSELCEHCLDDIYDILNKKAQFNKYEKLRKTEIMRAK